MQWALVVEYNGSRYAGFQIQSNVKTVQGELEHSLRILFAQPIRIRFAGRTDAGVHATGQVISFYSPNSTTKQDVAPEGIARSLNGLLPDDISIRGIVRVEDSFHPRYSCKARFYEYLIWNHPLRSVFWDKKAIWIKQKLPLLQLNRETEAILGSHDFSSFTPKIRTYDNPCRKVYTAKFIQNPRNRSEEKYLICFQICANAFLHNMVRVLVGSLVDISLGRLSYNLSDILKSRERERAGQTIAPIGLYLRHAYYSSTEIFSSDMENNCLAIWDEYSIS